MLKLSLKRISLITEPGSRYLSRITVATRTAPAVTTGILTCLQQKNIPMDSITIVDCDGTSVNTGVKGGIIRLPEVHLGHPLQWLVCLLLANEMLLQHLLVHIDGMMQGPSVFAGPKEKALTKCEDNPVLQLKPITAPDHLPNIDIVKYPNMNQKYL